MTLFDSKVWSSVSSLGASLGASVSFASALLGASLGLSFASALLGALLGASVLLRLSGVSQSLIGSSVFANVAGKGGGPVGAVGLVPALELEHPIAAAGVELGVGARARRAGSSSKARYTRPIAQRGGEGQCHSLSCRRSWQLPR